MSKIKRYHISAFIVVCLVTCCSQKSETAKSKSDTSLMKLINRIEFRNSGLVTQDMEFTQVTKKCFYIETDQEYTRRNDYDYTFEVKDGKEIDPPSGVRSAIPLGGLGAGTVELRADGRFMDWNIFNNSPATGNQKVQLDNAFLGLWVKGQSSKSEARVLRTHPEEGLPAIQKMEYSGSFPVSKLVISDQEINLQSTLYAYSEFHMRQQDRSGTPCALFSLVLKNPTNQPQEASFLFNLPNHIQGKFQADQALILSKSGKEPTSGDMTLAVKGADHVTYEAGNNLSDIWRNFSQEGELSGKIVKEGAFGAIGAKAKIAPGETRIVTIGLAWYFPERPHTNEILGNYYTRLYQNSTDVANKALSRLTETWSGIVEWNQACFDNTLPEWLQDALVNSMGTMFKTSLWTEDGRFRQWESFACPDIDAIHIHFARALPYELFFQSSNKV